jgi:hypothetical protein
MKRSRVREELELRATGILPVLRCQFHVTSKIIDVCLRVNLLRIWMGTSGTAKSR